MYISPIGARVYWLFIFIKEAIADKFWIKWAPGGGKDIVNQFKLTLN